MSEQPSIIFEDKNVLAIYKPNGYLSHPVKKGEVWPSITEWLVQKHPYLKNVGKSENRFAIIHRLDRETSGVILAAKNQATFDNLQKQFKERKIKKEYIALVEGKIEKGGVIDAPLTFIKNKREFKIEALSRDANIRIGANDTNKNKKIREAKTEFSVLKNYDNYTLLKVFPLTGRTHQIRAHLKSAHHPIIGDKRYNKKSLASRLFLHASAIEFSYPEGKKMRIEAALPEDFSYFPERNGVVSP